MATSLHLLEDDGRMAYEFRVMTAAYFKGAVEDEVFKALPGFRRVRYQPEPWYVRRWRRIRNTVSERARSIKALAYIAWHGISKWENTQDYYDY